MSDHFTHSSDLTVFPSRIEMRIKLSPFIIFNKTTCASDVFLRQASPLLTVLSVLSRRSVLSAMLHILLFFRIGMRQPIRKIPIICQENQTLRIFIQTTNRVDASWFVMNQLRHSRFIKSRTDCTDHSFRLVQYIINEIFFVFDDFAANRYLIILFIYLIRKIADQFSIHFYLPR